MERAMDGGLLDLTIFLIATFGAAVVAGLAGFAFGLAAAAVWLHILTPVQTASLIVGFGLVVQGVSVWKIRHALNWRRLWPFALGGILGVPVGATALDWSNPAHARAGIGGLLVLYTVYGLTRPQLQPIRAGGQTADAAVGFANGILGGATGLAGILVTIWSGLRGWPKDGQRAVFQPTAVFVFAVCAAWFSATGAIDRETAKQFAIGLPVLLGGTWLGLKFYSRLDEAGFRRIVLILLLLSGISLVGAFVMRT